MSHFKKAQMQSTEGIPSATSFDNILRLLQIKMTSSVILECFTKIDGVKFFCPIEFLSERRLRNVQSILEDGFNRILQEGEKVSNEKWWSHGVKGLIYGRKRLHQEIQQKVDPYLSTFYDVYSMTSRLTRPFVDPLAPVPVNITFQVRTGYIAEGEEDNVKVGSG